MVGRKLKILYGLFLKSSEKEPVMFMTRFAIIVMY